MLIIVHVVLAIGIMAAALWAVGSTRLINSALVPAPGNSTLAVSFVPPRVSFARAVPLGVSARFVDGVCVRSVLVFAIGLTESMRGASHAG